MENNLSIVKDQFKELPNNIEAEQAVIGSLLVNNEIFDEISTIISGINFYDPMHQKIFDAVDTLIYKGMLANPITLKNYFEDEKDDLNVPEYLVKKLSTENNELYGSVKPTEIAKLIQEENKIDITPSMIQPIEEIKSLGKFKVKVSLHSEVDAEIKINVSSADTIQ